MKLEEKIILLKESKTNNFYIDIISISLGSDILKLICIIVHVINI